MRKREVSEHEESTYFNMIQEFIFIKYMTVELLVIFRI